MPDIRKILLTIGRVAAPVVLNTFLPGSGGIVQIVENLLGSGTGSEKKKLATALVQSMLETLAKAGKLEGAAPTAEAIAEAVEATVKAMKKDGTLEEVGILKVAGQAYNVIVVGKVPE